MAVEIKYLKNFDDCRKNYKTVTHDELDTWTFDDFKNNGFAEMLDPQKYRRLYMDLDDMKTVEDFKSVEKWLDSLSKHFGEYAICGYTTDKNIYKELKHMQHVISHINIDKVPEGYDRDYHTISIHVVFYEIKMDVVDLYNIFGLNQNTYGNVNEFIDRSVYKQSANSNQLLRHPFSNKYKYRDDQKSWKICGFDFEKHQCEYEASQLVATPRGNERIVTKDEWLKVFPMIENAEQEQKQTASEEPKITFVNPDAELSDWAQMLVDDAKEEFQTISPEEVIKDLNERYTQSKNHITKELFDTIVKGFEGLEIHGDVEPVDKEITLFPLFSALYACICDEVSAKDVEKAIRWISRKAKLTTNADNKWDDKLEQAQNNDKCEGPGVLFIYLKNFNNEYYTQHVLPLVTKYRKQAVLEAKFDLKDNFTIKDIRMKGLAREYQKDGDAENLDYDAVLCDLHRVMLVVDQGSGLYVLKERDAKNDRMTVGYYNQETAFKMLKQLKVGSELKQKQYRKGEEHQLVNKSAFDVYDASTNNAMFYKSSICFYSENPEDFSFFQGYKYEPVQNDALIEKFNNHIREVICNNNETLYNYVQSWFATVIQEPLARTCTALVIKGTEGTGKNTVTDVCVSC